MKIKGDFVTNSSSTAYVMHMPKAFMIPVEVMIDILDPKSLAQDHFEESDMTPEAEEQMILEISFKVVEDLKNGEKIYSEDYDGDYASLRHNIAWTIMEEFGLEIDSIELGGGGGMDVIIPVGEKAVENATKKGMKILETKIKDLYENSKSIGETL